MADYGEMWRKASCNKGEIMVMWLGQAGFLFKNSQGKTLVLDAYLSDLSMRKDGNKRLTPAIISPSDVNADVVLASHYHTDHLDIDSLPEFLKSGAMLYCSENCDPICREASLPMQQVQKMAAGDVVEDSGFRITAVFADHGDTSPDALGFVIETDGIRIYYTGDTSYQMDRMRLAFRNEIDLLIGPINGEYGNMNACDLAMLSELSRAKLTIPCHFWTFARHKGDPFEFEMAMKYMAPKQGSYIMCQGEILRYPC